VLHAVVALAVVVALSVDATAKARLGEHALVDAAVLAQLDLCLEDVDLLRQVRGHLPLQAVAPADRAHPWSPRGTPSERARTGAEAGP
jgi:hypothetical protein